MADHEPYPPNGTHLPQTRVPWPLIAIVLAGVLVAVIFIVRQNRRAVAESLPPNALHISGVTIVNNTAAPGGNVHVYGEITDNADLRLTDATLSAEFKDDAGHTVYVAQQSIERVEVQNGGKNSTEKSFAEDPLKPRQTAAFVVSYSQVPSSWNHQPPQLRVLEAHAMK